MAWIAACTSRSGVHGGPKLPLPIAIVVHSPRERDSRLPQVLSRKGHNPVTFAADGAAIEPGHLYVAPPDVHLLIEGRMFRLSSGPRENGFGPAVDALFRTAALAYGARLMGVILSGALDDGTLGLGQVKASGGTTVVQDPAEARVPSMPQNALCSVEVDYTLPAAGIAELIAAAAAGMSTVSSGSRPAHAIRSSKRIQYAGCCFDARGPRAAARRSHRRTGRRVPPARQRRSVSGRRGVDRAEARLRL